MAKVSSEETKTLLLCMRDGLRKKITIPAGWKVTFGPLVPGSKDTSINGRDAMTLRLWSGSKGAEIQHAVFTGVEAFRDTSIELIEEVEETRQETFRKEGDASAEAIVAEVKVKNWVNPDKPETTSQAASSATRGSPGRLIQLVDGSLNRS